MTVVHKVSLLTFCNSLAMFVHIADRLGIKLYRYLPPFFFFIRLSEHIGRRDNYDHM